MGVLESSGRRVVLPCHALVGRQRSCFLLLSSPSASSEHALIAWLGTHWGLRDLGSRNGTTLDDSKLQPSQVMPLRAGSRICFGDAAEAWTLVDDAPPQPMAIDLVSREVRVGVGGILALPDEDHPVAVIYEAATPGSWLLEQDLELRPLEGAMAPVMAGSTWMVFLPDAHQLTPHHESAPSISTSTFRFFVSKNEEHVRLVVAQGGSKVVLEAREHYYLLLTLARQRLAQRSAAIEDRGWMSRDELVRRLHTDINSIDVAIHRSRRRLEAAGVLGAPGIVEVRRGERRFGSDLVEIIEE